MLGAAIGEFDGMAVGEDHRVMERVVRRPELHVGDVEGVADVDGVIEQDRGAILRYHLIDQPLLAVAAGPDQGRFGERAFQARGRCPLG